MYKLSPEMLGASCVVRLADNASIPFDEGNADYQKYLRWLNGYEYIGEEWVKTSDGNTPLPADQ